MTQVDLVVLEAALASLGASTHLEVQAPDWGVRASGLRSPYRSHIHYKFLPGHGGPERLLLRNYRYVLVVAEHPPKIVCAHSAPPLDRKVAACYCEGGGVRCQTATARTASGSTA